MALSKIDITLVADFVNGDSIGFTYTKAGQNFVITYDCVTVVSLPREFAEGVPTGTLGETAAINYEAEFITDDVPNGFFTITRAINVLTITATTIDIDFIGIVVSPFSSATAVVTNSNFQKKINVRSPYFINTPTNAGAITPDSSELDLFVWTGDLTADEPVTPTYTLTAEATNFGDSGIYFEVAELVRDFITHTFNNDYPSKAAWVKYDITTTHSGGTINQVETLLAMDGYTAFKDGVNFIGEPEAGGYNVAPMLTNREIYVYDQDILRVPVYRNSTSLVEFLLNSVVEETVNYTSSDLTSEVIVYPEYEDLPNGGLIDEVRITNSDTGNVTTIDVIPVTECKYDVYKVTFINKFGALQDMHFFKTSRESLTTTKQEYRANPLTVTNGSVGYSTTEHQFKDFLVRGNKSITLNSGYLSEEYNAVFDELQMSERIWLTLGSTVCPVTITTLNRQEKTRINDKLIAYTIDFKYAFDEMNNVR